MIFVKACIPWSQLFELFFSFEDLQSKRIHLNKCQSLGSSMNNKISAFQEISPAKALLIF
ncbi:hypothetical protein ASL14_12900 [Paenibacillus sp. IHB B 3084]|nr:hypothetical protein ASL14_12900 [Paenibacillus sp. IHB B 3084]